MLERRTSGSVQLLKVRRNVHPEGKVSGGKTFGKERRKEDDEGKVLEFRATSVRHH